MKKTVMDLITHDPATDEFVIYIVESPPWGEDALDQRLREIQDKIYDAFDIAVDGHLAKRFPTSSGKAIRIQVDLRGNAPADVKEFVRKMSSHLGSDMEMVTAVKRSTYLSGLRLVSVEKE